MTTCLNRASQAAGWRMVEANCSRARKTSARFVCSVVVGTFKRCGKPLQLPNYRSYLKLRVDSAVTSPFSAETIEVTVVPLTAPAS